MSRPYALHPESFIAPSFFSPYLHISFRLPYESRDPIFPASALQLSFHRPSHDQELFIEPRIAAHDVAHTDTGLCSVRVAQDAIPRYGPTPTPTQDDRTREHDDDDDDDTFTVVKLHAWKGEKHLGAWEVGRLSAADMMCRS